MCETKVHTNWAEDEDCNCMIAPCCCEPEYYQQMNFENLECADCISKEVYVRFLQSLYLIYNALEDELTRNAQSLSFRNVILPTKLFRRNALSKDLKAFLGPDWKQEVKSTRATDAYVKRIREVGQSDPELLLAHHSTRYLGDLCASEVMRDKTKQFFSLDGDLGLNFYKFDSISDFKDFRKNYFEAVGALDTSRELRARVSKEARLVYQLNMNLYWEIRGFMMNREEGRVFSLDGKYGRLSSGAGSKSRIADAAITANDANAAANATSDAAAKIRNSETEENINKTDGNDSPQCASPPLFAFSLLFWVGIWLLAGFVLYSFRGEKTDSDR